MIKVKDLSVIQQHITTVQKLDDMLGKNTLEVKQGYQNINFNGANDFSPGMAEAYADITAALRKYRKAVIAELKQLGAVVDE